MSAVILQFPRKRPPQDAAVPPQQPSESRLDYLRRCAIAELAGYGVVLELPEAEPEAVELDHANREALAALELSSLIMARNRHSLAWPDADKVGILQERIEAMREGVAGVEEFDRLHLLDLRVARNQIQWLLDRVERKQARAKAKKREG